MPSSCITSPLLLPLPPPLLLPLPPPLLPPLLPPLPRSPLHTTSPPSPPLLVLPLL